MKSKSHSEVLAARVKIRKEWAYKIESWCDSIEEFANNFFITGLFVIGFEFVLAWPILFLAAIFRGLDDWNSTIFFTMLGIAAFFVAGPPIMLLPLWPIAKLCERIKDAEFKLYVNTKCIYCAYQMDKGMQRCPECGNAKDR